MGRLSSACSRRARAARALSANIAFLARAFCSFCFLAFSLLYGLFIMGLALHLGGLLGFSISSISVDAGENVLDHCPVVLHTLSIPIEPLE